MAFDEKSNLIAPDLKFIGLRRILYILYEGQNPDTQEVPIIWNSDICIYCEIPFYIKLLLFLT